MNQAYVEMNLSKLPIFYFLWLKFCLVTALGLPKVMDTLKTTSKPSIKIINSK